MVHYKGNTSSKYEDKTSLCPKANNAMVLKFAVTSVGAVTIVNWAFSFGLGCGAWDWASLRPALDHRTIWGFLILEIGISQY